MTETVPEGESIDFRHYVKALRKYRWLIGVCTVIPVAISALFSLGQSPVYQASSLVAIVKSQTRVTLDPNIKTLTEIELGKEMFNLSARRNAFAALVSNSLVEAEVAAKLRDHLTPAERKPGGLIPKVEGSIQEGTDLIEITVEAEDPEKAAAIANEWGYAYERYINRTYGATEAATSISKEQVASYKAEVDQAQKTVVEFIQQNRAGELSRLVEEKNQLIAGLQAGKQKTIGQFLATLAQADTVARTEVITKAIEADVNALADSYATKRRSEQLLGDARALRDQVRKGDSAATANGLPLMLLKTQAFASSVSLPHTLEISLTDPTSLDTGPAQQLRELDSFIAVIEARIAQLQDTIKGQTATLQNYPAKDQLPGKDPQGFLQLHGAQSLDAFATAMKPLNDRIDELQKQVQELQAQLEQTNAKHGELTKARDLALETYTSITRKLAETQISSQLASTEVRFASPAMVSKEPINPIQPRTIAMSGIFGLLIGVIAALMLDYVGPWWSRAKQGQDRI